MDIAEKIYWILIEEGQRNLKFPLGSVITNTPDEVRDIVRKHIKNIDEKDIAKKPMRSTEARYGMSYDYHDWICPSCKYFLTYEPNWRKIPKRCPECGQLLDKLTREEAEE